MDAGEHAERLLKERIEGMSVPFMEEELQRLGRGAAEFIPDCLDCPRKHPQELMFRESKDGHVTVRDSVIILTNGALMLQRMSSSDRTMAVGSVQKATVASITSKGFEVRELVNAVYLFVEQEKMIRMCGGVKPALA